MWKSSKTLVSIKKNPGLWSHADELFPSMEGRDFNQQSWLLQPSLQDCPRAGRKTLQSATFSRKIASEMSFSSTNHQSILPSKSLNLIFETAVSHGESCRVVVVLCLHRWKGGGVRLHPEVNSPSCVSRCKSERDVCVTCCSPLLVWFPGKNRGVLKGQKQSTSVVGVTDRRLGRSRKWRVQYGVWFSS